MPQKIAVGAGGALARSATHSIDTPGHICKHANPRRVTRGSHTASKRAAQRDKRAACAAHPPQTDAPASKTLGSAAHAGQGHCWHCGQAVDCAMPSLGANPPGRRSSAKRAMSHVNQEAPLGCRRPKGGSESTPWEARTTNEWAPASGAITRATSTPRTSGCCGSRG